MGPRHQADTAARVGATSLSLRGLEVCMSFRAFGVLLLAFLCFGYQSSASGPVERPFKAQIYWTVAGVDFAPGFPGGTSTFEGRCSVPSDYVISATYEGEMTHLGRATGQTSHCTQIDWQTGTSTYSDGLLTAMAANGDEIYGHYDNGVSGIDPQSGMYWFEDDFTITGGTGRFANASGGGQEGGTFPVFAALMSGYPVPMWEKGTIKY